MNEYNYEYPVYRHKYRQPSPIKRWCTAIFASIVKCGKDFCNDTSIHGFNHIAAPRRVWIERVLWIFACGLATWGALHVSLGQLQRYNESPTVVTLEKNFRSWRFSLPAVTCCYVERKDATKLPNVIKKHFNVDATDEKYAYYSRFVNAIVNSDLFHLEKFQEFQDLKMEVDMYQIAVDVAPEVKIKSMASETANWKWWPVMTEAGVCYVTNSLALADVAIIKPKPNETMSSPVTCKNTANNCYMVLENSVAIKYYAHSPYDVLDLTMEATASNLSQNFETTLSTMESRCGRGVKELHPQRRGCLYTDEPVGEGRRVYSTNSCRLSCRSRLAKKLCGCIPFYYFYEGGPICTPAGMWCLSSFAMNITSNNGQKCPCAPQCVDSVFKEINKKELNWNSPLFTSGSVRFIVQGPTTRYTREIVFHFQDLVVSFGGAVGLFLGASFISFIEILYFVLARLFTAMIRNEKNVKTQKTSAIEMKPYTTSYETIRIKQLTNVLESQRKYQQYEMQRLYY